MDWRKKITASHLFKGRRAETIARKFLTKQGLKLLETNYRCRYGEIDLIMHHQTGLIFVEVRYRKTTSFGLAQETVTLSKQRKIIRTAQHYLNQRKKTDQCPCRFDIVAIHGTIPGHEINWIKNAFDAQL